MQILVPVNGRQQSQPAELETQGHSQEEGNKKVGRRVKWTPLPTLEMDKVDLETFNLIVNLVI